MNRDEIYDHLAQVYLGKRSHEDTKKKKQFNAWLFINVITTLVIFASVFYGMTAFFTHKRPALEDKIFYLVHNGPVKIEYDFRNTMEPKRRFSLDIPDVDATKYQDFRFMVRSKEEGTPGIIKVVVANMLGEVAYYYVQGINMGWHEVSIPLAEFKQITDWTRLKDISCVIESWNVDDKTGVILIDDISFVGINKAEL